MKEEFDNTAIESVEKEDGPKIVAFYESLGFNVTGYLGTQSKKDKHEYRYYGVYKGKFDNRSNFTIKSYNMQILDISVIDTGIISETYSIF